MRAGAGYQWRDRDSATRMRDVIALHRLVLSIEEIMAGRYVAIALSSGGSDGQVYDSREEAVKHQRASISADHVLYMRIPPSSPDAATCDTILWYARVRYDAGYRPATGHAGTDIILPQAIEGYRPA